MKFHLDFYSIVMIICLLGIFALTIMNKTGFFTGLWFYIILLAVFAIMLLTFIIFLKKSEEAKKKAEGNRKI